MISGVQMFRLHLKVKLVSWTSRFKMHTGINIFCFLSQFGPPGHSVDQTLAGITSPMAVFLLSCREITEQKHK